MTKFEELMDIISKKKNKGKLEQENNYDNQLEVAGSETSKTPLLSCGDEEIDGSIIDDLYRKNRHKPRGDSLRKNGLGLRGSIYLPLP